MTTTGSKSGYTPQQILNYQKNDELLLKTKDVQGKTLQSLDRTKKDLYQADKAADKALQNLQDQREKLISIIDDTNRVYSSLERSEELVHKLGYGFRFPAIFQLSETQKKVYSDIIGIYEHQQYSFMSKSWSSSDFFSSQNTSFSVTDVFDPQLTMEDGRFFWVVDISFSHIDSDGWVYGSSFNEIDKGNGKESSQGFVFNLVRRRVWKRNTEAKISKNEEVLMRNIQRKQQQQQSSHDNIPSSSKKSVNNNNDITLLMVGTKYVHNDMTSDQEKSLKEIKATDKKIDEGVEEVEKGVDNLLSKAKLANNEMKVQQVLIEEMDENVDRDLNKVKDVNKQLKHKVDNQCSCIIS